MKRLMCCLLLFALGVTQPTFAAGIVHIADGDCAALITAMGAPPGQEPALIVLARNGTYTCSTLTVNGTIAVDAAGAILEEPASFTASIPKPEGIVVGAAANLLLRNAIIGSTQQGPNAAASSIASQPAPKFCCVSNATVVSNQGSLTLDMVTLTGLSYTAGPEFFTFGIINNSGHLTMRNVSAVGNTYSGIAPALVANSGTTEISHSTFVTTPNGYAQALFSSDGSGVISIANSVISNNGYAAAPDCTAGTGRIVSLGGNVVSDSTCGFNAANDRIVADVRPLDLGTHGGVVPTLALNYDSPAIGNGLLANCEATDARGLARGATACDSGAYEIGGGDGKLSATGMSGLYFNASNNGHYISIQRLAGHLALVIWNTFDQHGTPAWLYGVGTVSGNHIHVEQVAQNVGGILHAGGGVSGATPTLWGTFDINLSDCYTASLSYNSALPQFGSGSTTLQRLAFLDGVNCAR